jgi:hypothetical protein
MMKKRKPVLIDWSELEMALAWRADEGDHYLDVTTGEVVGFTGLDDDLTEDEVEAGIGEGRLLPIEPLPSSVEYGWMEEFTSSVTDASLRRLLEFALDGAGAFRRFKDALREAHAERERWFAFRSERLREVAREWLEENGIETEADGRGRWLLPSIDRPSLPPAFLASGIGLARRPVGGGRGRERPSAAALPRTATGRGRGRAASEEDVVAIHDEAEPEDPRQLGLFSAPAVLRREIEGAIERGDFEAARRAREQAREAFGPRGLAEEFALLVRLGPELWGEPSAAVLAVWQDIDASLEGRTSLRARVRDFIFAKLREQISPMALALERPDLVGPLYATLVSLDGPGAARALARDLLLIVALLSAEGFANRSRSALGSQHVQVL